ncbi:MAG: DMT family transporter [Synergistaceae bacterium]|jgi:drug/metabolite transporter (DMT)-like permease|nr:DMT family transporter [Synergistaceae bacterium]
MMNKRLLGNFLLGTTAFIWGTSFVAIVKGLRIMSPYAFSAYRFLLSFLFILGVTLLYDVIKKPGPDAGSDSFWRRASDWKKVFKAGLLCGSFLFFATAFQQIGLQNTQAGKAAFITTLYIVIVPIFCIFLGKKIPWTAWIAVFLGVVGLYLLSVNEKMEISLPDTLVLIGSFFWAGHIMACDYFVAKCDPLKMSSAQFGFASLFFILATLLLEKIPSYDLWLQTFPFAFFAGLVASGIGFTLQIFAQRHTAPTSAALILSMESVFAALAGYFFLSERLSAGELSGCLLIFCAIILTQIRF